MWLHRSCTNRRWWILIGLPPPAGGRCLWSLATAPSTKWWRSPFQRRWIWPDERIPLPPSNYSLRHWISNQDTCVRDCVAALSPSRPECTGHRPIDIDLQLIEFRKEINWGFLQITQQCFLLIFGTYMDYLCILRCIFPRLEGKTDFNETGNLSRGNIPRFFIRL